MNNIWVFGDSFSMDMNRDTTEFAKNYVRWKGRPVKNYADFIAEKLKYTVKNFAKGGNDNYSIFQSICQNIHNISNYDFIFIGWGPIHRFRLIDHKNNQWVIVNGNQKYECIDLKEEDIGKLRLNRDHKLHYQELHDWIKLLKVLLKDNFIFDWSWYKDGFFDRYEKIWDETKYEINDQHWSENSHKIFSDLVLNKIKNWQDGKIDNRW